MRLLTRVDSEFARLLADKIQRVDIATAWATEGPGLDALEELADKRRNVKVRALVGVSGGQTTPKALKRLDKIGKVRLVEDVSLFHVKLYLFHKRSTSVAWIGSANFTRSGFEYNEELIFETTDVAKAADWFNRRWRGIDAAQSRKKLQEYFKTWKRPTTDRPDLEPPPEDNDRIVFVQDGERPPPPIEGTNNRKEPARGSIKLAGKSFSYKSAQEAVKLVLRKLQTKDASFLGRCDKDSRFHPGKTHLIARSKEGLGTPYSNKHPNKICDGWWMSTHTTTQKKWRIIEWAAEIAELQVRVEGKCWENVGF